MEWPEVIAKLSITIIFAALGYFFIFNNLIICVIFGHTLNFIVFSQLFVVARYYSNDGMLDQRKFNKIITMMWNLQKHKGVKNIYFGGSMCREALRPTSDIDIRVETETSTKNFVVAYNVLWIRLIANFYGLPIDIYSFYRARFLNKMRSDEILLTLLPVQNNGHRKFKLLTNEVIAQCKKTLR